MQDLRNCRMRSHARDFSSLGLTKIMLVLVYCQKKLFYPELVLLRSSSVLVDKNNLIKVATVKCNGLGEKALQQAFALTQHGDRDWYGNKSVVCHCDSARSSACSDIFYLADSQKWYMAAEGWWEHGDRWQFEGDPPMVEDE